MLNDDRTWLAANRCVSRVLVFFFFFQAEDGIRDLIVTGVQTCALPISIPDFLVKGVSAGARSRPDGAVLRDRSVARRSPRTAWRRCSRRTSAACSAEIGRASCRERV